MASQELIPAQKESLASPGSGPLIQWMTIVLVILLTVAGYGGLFWPSIYARETLNGIAQGRGADAANILVAVPVLIISVNMALRKSLAARLVWLGTLLFVLYNFVIYALDVHFNRFFLVYCAIFGLSFYSVLMGVKSLPVEEIVSRYGPRAPMKTISVLFLLIAAFFGAQWLREIVPALWAGTAPASATETGLPNPVHFLDLSMALPAYCIVGIAAWRRKPMAYVWTPILMVLGIVMFIAIAMMMYSMGRMGFPMASGPIAVIVAAAVAFTLLFARYVRA